EHPHHRGHGVRLQCCGGHGHQRGGRNGFRDGGGQQRDRRHGQGWSGWPVQRHSDRQRRYGVHVGQCDGWSCDRDGRGGDCEPEPWRQGLRHQDPPRSGGVQHPPAQQAWVLFKAYISGLELGMALGDNYATDAELKTRLGISDSNEDAAVAAAMSTASRNVEKYCRRQFNDAETASARRYFPLNRDVVLVDDLWTTT